MLTCFDELPLHVSSSVALKRLIKHTLASHQLFKRNRYLRAFKASLVGFYSSGDDRRNREHTHYRGTPISNTAFVLAAETQHAKQHHLLHQRHHGSLSWNQQTRPELTLTDQNHLAAVDFKNHWMNFLHKLRDFHAQGSCSECHLSRTHSRGFSGACTDVYSYPGTLSVSYGTTTANDTSHIVWIN